MKVFHIDQFKCTLCSNWFCPPFNLPYRLKCTHSICTKCLEKSVENRTNQIICPEDMQRNKVSQITINQSTKKALQRLLKQHKNFTQTNHLECIKSLSISFDQLLDSKQIQLKNLSTLIDQIFQNQIKRLRQIYQKIKIQINRPFRIVNDWKQVVKNYLKKVKTLGPNIKGCVTQFNHYIEEGRKIKLDLNQYLKHDFTSLVEHLLIQPQVCFTHTFTIFDNFQKQTQKNNYCSTSKFETLGKRYQTIGKKQNRRQVCLQDMTNNLEQSSIRMGKQNFQQNNENTNKLSLFESLIQDTPKNGKSLKSQFYEETKKTPFRNMGFQSANNNEAQNLMADNLLKDDMRTQTIRFNPYNSPNEQFNKGLNEKLNSTLEAGAKDYNNMLKDKIKKNKEKIHQQSTKKHTKMGKSLQYSPEQPNYESLQPYTLHDSFYQEQTTNNEVRKLSLNSFYEDQTNYRNQAQSVKMKRISQFNQDVQRQIDNEDEQLLLDQKSERKEIIEQRLVRNDWQLENLNFLREWKISKNEKGQEELQIIQKYGGYNCQKEKNKYARKIQELKVKQILKETNVSDNYISIVGQSLADCNLMLLLSQIDWNYRDIQIVKFIKTSLSDQQLNQLLNFLVRSKVHTLMLSYNNLTELSLDALLNFGQINHRLKNIYLPKNNISLLKGNARAKINLLKQKGINLYI